MCGPQMCWAPAGAGGAGDGGGQGDHVHRAGLLQLRRLRGGQGRGGSGELVSLREVKSNNEQELDYWLITPHTSLGAPPLQRIKLESWQITKPCK